MTPALLESIRDNWSRYEQPDCDDECYETHAECAIELLLDHIDELHRLVVTLVGPLGCRQELDVIETTDDWLTNPNAPPPSGYRTYKPGRVHHWVGTTEVRADDVTLLKGLMRRD